MPGEFLLDHGKAAGKAAVQARAPHPPASILRFARAGLAWSVLPGGHIRNPWWIAWLPGRTPMVHKTAVSLLSLAAAHYEFERGRDRIGRRLAGIARLPSLLALFEYVRGAFPGIDQALTPAGNPPGAGRIAPSTCALRVRSGGARGPTIEKAASQRLRDSAAGLEVGVDQRTLELQAVHLALRESEELFRRIFGDAPIGAALPDQIGRAHV